MRAPPLDAKCARKGLLKKRVARVIQPANGRRTLASQCPPGALFREAGPGIRFFNSPGNRANARHGVRRAAARCILAAAAVLAACVSTGFSSEFDPELDLWPLVRYDSGPGPDDRSLEALWPVVEWNRDDSRSDFFLRPLANRRHDLPSKIAESEWPWPIGFGTGRPDLSRQVVFPLLLRDRETFSDRTVQNRFILLPVFYYKAREGKPTSFAVFPLYGRYHHMFGREKAWFALWPLYVYHREKAMTKHAVLHPVFAYKRWDDGGRGFKMWPLFGLDRRPEKMTRWFAAWPVLNYYHRTRPDGEVSRFTVFPLYGRIREPGGSETALLWPFFSHRVETAPGRDDWWYPWPILGNHLGEKSRGWTFLPVYSSQTTPTGRRVRFLWPMGWYRREEFAQEHEKSLRLVPLFFVEREERALQNPDAPKKRLATGAWQAWPLVKKRWVEDDWTDVEIPSIVPVRHYGPWERNFAPFFRVFRYHHDTERGGSWRIFERLLRCDSGPPGMFFELTPVLSIGEWRDENGSAFQWKLLKGLAGYERTAEGSSLRALFFLRVPLSRSTEKEGPDPE